MAFPHDGKKFQKGESGNPNGRPKKLPDIDELLAEVLGEEKDGIEAARAILLVYRNKALKGDIRAGELLFNRAYGMARQNVDANINTTEPLVVVLTPEEDDEV
jgi:hypothetical protein